MRQSSSPVDERVEKPMQQHRELKGDGNALSECQNFYQEDSAATSLASERNHPIRTPEDYEAFAMRQLSRHACNKSTTTDGSAGLDWGDPRRRYEADNAV